MGKSRLIDLSATPTATEAQGNLALSQRRFRHLCARGSQVEITELLKQWTGSPNDLNNSPSPFPSPLCEAARHGHASLLEDLATRGFSLFSEEGPHETVPEAATEGASRTGNTEVLELLLKNGWDPNVSSGRTTSLMSLALENEDVVRWFLVHGADANGPSSYLLNLTVTTYAASRAPLSVLKLLLIHGGTISGTDAMAQAVIGHNRGVPGRLEVVDYLLDNGAPIDVYAYKDTDEYGPVKMACGLETGLHLATMEGKQDMVDLLLRRGADRNIRTDLGVLLDYWPGDTALEIAERKGFDSIARLLRGENVMQSIVVEWEFV